MFTKMFENRNQLNFIKTSFTIFLITVNFQATSTEYVRVTVADITSSDSEKIIKAVNETERIVEKIIGRNIDIMIETDFPKRIIFSTRPPSLDLLMKNTSIVNSDPEFRKLQKFLGVAVLV